jgi:hypothetical protein
VSAAAAAPPGVSASRQTLHHLSVQHAQPHTIHKPLVPHAPRLAVAAAPLLAPPLLRNYSRNLQQRKVLSVTTLTYTTNNQGAYLQRRGGSRACGRASRKEMGRRRQGARHSAGGEGTRALRDDRRLAARVRARAQALRREPGCWGVRRVHAWCCVSVGAPAVVVEECGPCEQRSQGFRACIPPRARKHTCARKLRGSTGSRRQRVTASNQPARGSGASAPGWFARSRRARRAAAWPGGGLRHSA